MGDSSEKEVFQILDEEHGNISSEKKEIKNIDNLILKSSKSADIITDKNNLIQDYSNKMRDIKREIDDKLNERDIESLIRLTNDNTYRNKLRNLLERTGR